MPKFLAMFSRYYAYPIEADSSDEAMEKALAMTDCLPEDIEDYSSELYFDCIDSADDE